MAEHFLDLFCQLGRLLFARSQPRLGKSESSKANSRAKQSLLAPHNGKKCFFILHIDTNSSKISQYAMDPKLSSNFSIVSISNDSLSTTRERKKMMNIHSNKSLFVWFGPRTFVYFLTFFVSPLFLTNGWSNKISSE